MSRDDAVDADQLREREARHRALLGAMPDLMFRLSRDGTYLDYNAPRGAPGVPRDQVVGRNLRDTMPAEAVELALEAIERALSSGEVELIEYTMPHEGEPRDFEARLVRSGADEVVATVRDVTEAHRARDLLERSRDELEQRVMERTRELSELNDALRAEIAERRAKEREARDAQAQLVQSEKMASLGMLVAGIAHEINTPVGAVHSMQDTLIRAVSTLRTELEAGHTLSESKKLQTSLRAIEGAIKVIGSGASRVTEIVRRLRSFARLDEASLKRVDLHEGLEDTLMLLHHELKHGVSVERDYGELPEVACYPGRLNQVFLNLLNNARQAIDPPGTIRIRTRLEGDEVRVEIRDDGCGISEENLARIFDPGFTTKGVGVGTGLGLSISYKIIQEHRGRLEVQSQQGAGSTFTVIIPTNLDELLET